MSTTTTNFGLIKPELTDAANITAFNSNWDTIDTKLKDAENQVTKSVIVNTTLSASSWGSNVYTWSNNNIKSANQVIELIPANNITATQLEALQMANIVGTSQDVGSVTFKAYGEVPTINIPVTFIIRGDV